MARSTWWRGSPPRPALRDRDAQVGGLWETGGGHESASLYVEWTGPACASQAGRRPCRVYFYAGGCMSAWSLRRSGVYSAKDGLLLLDRPVKDYSGPAYRRLFAMRVEGDSYLVPDVFVAQVEREAAGRKRGDSPFSRGLTARDYILFDSFGRKKPGDF